MRTLRWVTIAMLALIACAAQAATPPGWMHYQGVLRDAAGNPLNGSYEMMFRFYDGYGGGNLLLSDRHWFVEEVPVDNGLFHVTLGTGQVTPGVYPDLAQMFAAEEMVYLEIEVNNDGPMTPRIPLLTVAYAFNADTLDGKQGAEFLDTSSTPQTKEGPLTVDGGVGEDVAFRADGYVTGGVFTGLESTASIASGPTGISASGYFLGGSFSGGETGISASSQTTPGSFQNSITTGQAFLGRYDRGIEASGKDAGGQFTQTGCEYGYFCVGVSGQGDNWGGYFTGNDGGVYGRGANVGALFENVAGLGRAWLSRGAKGIEVEGGVYATGVDASPAGRFTNGGFIARLATQTDTPIGALGSAGSFSGSGSTVTLAQYVADAGFYGIRADGDTLGGEFSTGLGSGYVTLANQDLGVDGSGDDAGGRFTDSDGSGFALVGYDTYKIQGTGAVSFVQNHPYDSGRVIVYAAPEGDEVANYTRGTARLVGGVARVDLGETFRWVTNPDLGLTAHLTPRGEPVALAVESLTTSELVVRGAADATTDVEFDYLVYGLRIGFEEVSIVQEKQEEAYIPSMKTHRERYGTHPELEQYNAMSRFLRMREDRGRVDPPSLEAAVALRNAIQEFDVDVHGPVVTSRRRVASSGNDAGAEAGEATVAVQRGGRSARPPTRSSVAAIPVDAEGNAYATSFRSRALDFATVVEVAEPVEPGDVLVIDAETADLMALSREAADPRVFGVVAADAGMVLGYEPPSAAGAEAEVDGSGESTLPEIDAPTRHRVAVALSGIVTCKVDAGYGEIRPGDLLTTSPTPGHAMLAGEPAPGTIVGKALEALAVGTGKIRVLVTVR